MWEVFKESAERFGYAKLKILHEEYVDLASRTPNLVVPRGRYLTYAPIGSLTTQLMELKIAIQMAQKKSGRTLILPPLFAESVQLFSDAQKDKYE